jgi:hypothetical protein
MNTLTKDSSLVDISRVVGQYTDYEKHLDHSVGFQQKPDACFNLCGCTAKSTILGFDSRHGQYRVGFCDGKLCRQFASLLQDRLNLHLPPLDDKQEITLQIDEPWFVKEDLRPDRGVILTTQKGGYYRMTSYEFESLNPSYPTSKEIVTNVNKHKLTVVYYGLRRNYVVLIDNTKITIPDPHGKLEEIDYENDLHIPIEWFCMSNHDYKFIATHFSSKEMEILKKSTHGIDFDTHFIINNDSSVPKTIIKKTIFEYIIDSILRDETGDYAIGIRIRDFVPYIQTMVVTCMWSRPSLKMKCTITDVKHTFASRKVSYSKIAQQFDKIQSIYIVPSYAKNGNPDYGIKIHFDTMKYTIHDGCYVGNIIDKLIDTLNYNQFTRKS